MDGVGWQRKLVQKQWGSVAATPEVKVTRQFYSGQNPTGPCGRRQEPYWAWLLGKHSLPPVGKLSSKLALSWLKPATSPATGGPSWAHDAAIYWPRLGLVPSWCLLQTLWPLHTMTWSSNIFALCTQPCQPHLLVLLHSAHPEHLLLPAFFAHAVLSAWKSILQDLVWGLFFFFFLWNLSCQHPASSVLAHSSVSFWKYLSPTPQPKTYSLAVIFFCTCLPALLSHKHS